MPCLKSFDLIWMCATPCAASGVYTAAGAKSSTQSKAKKNPTRFQRPSNLKKKKNEIMLKKKISALKEKVVSINDRKRLDALER